jgi:predicted HicB family RNase H-like nuclease
MSNTKTTKIVWVEKDLHKIFSVEAAKNGMRVGGYVNKLLRDYVVDKGLTE